MGPVMSLSHHQRLLQGKTYFPVGFLYIAPLLVGPVHYMPTYCMLVVALFLVAGCTTSACGQMKAACPPFIRAMWDTVTSDLSCLLYTKSIDNCKLTGKGVFLYSIMGKC